MIIKQRSLFVIFWLALMMVACASAWAETIKLKNGRIFEGEIAEESGEEVRIIMKSGIVTFSRDEIASIGDRKISEKDIKEAVKSLSTPVPVKKPAAKKTTASAAASKPVQKKKQKAVTKVKKQGTPGKTAQPINLPAATTETITFTSFAASTDTVTSASSVPISSPAALPVKPQKQLSPGVKAAIATIAIAIIILNAFMIKRIKKKTKNIK